MKIKIDSLDTIHEAAKEFLQNMGDGKVFAFYGKMGAGKTTFVKAICEELGVEDVITSPTFALVNEYTAGDGSPVYHFDSTASRNSMRFTTWATKIISTAATSVSWSGRN